MLNLGKIYSPGMNHWRVYFIKMISITLKIIPIH
nr:MAG TPA: hypothetical protein [Caudoviricetes sp.]